MPPQNVPLWRVNYFELKGVKNLRLMRTFYLSLQEFNLGALPIISMITRNNCVDQSIWQGKHLLTTTMTFLPSEAPKCLTSSLAQNVTYTRSSFQLCLGTSRVCGIPMCIVCN